MPYGGVLRGSFRVQAADADDVARRRLRLLALMACSRGATAVTAAVRAGLQAAGVAPSNKGSFSCVVTIRWLFAECGSLYCVRV